MIFYYTIPLLLGLAIVTQGALNQVVGSERGLGFAVFLNASIFFALSLILLFISTRFSSTISAILPIKTSDDSFKWYYIIPGLCGFLIVLGSPVAMANIGVTAFFVLLISAQILTSFLYDSLLLHSPFNLTKIVGAILTFVGAALFISSRK